MGRVLQSNLSPMSHLRPTAKGTGMCIAANHWGDSLRDRARQRPKGRLRTRIDSAATAIVKPSGMLWFRSGGRHDRDATPPRAERAVSPLSMAASQMMGSGP